MSSENKTHQGLSSISRDSRDVAAYYDDWADNYDNTLDKWNYKSPDQAALLLKEKTDVSSKILDAGCGTGLSGRALKKCGFKNIDGIDISQQSLDIAQKNNSYKKLLKIDMQEYPFPIKSGSYDALICVGVLTYLPESFEILKEFCRLVKQDGVIILTQRDDIFKERNFHEVLNKLSEDNIIKELYISPPKPYLPDNEEFAEKIQVHYIIFKSAKSYI